MQQSRFKELWIDTWKFAKNVDIANLKSDVDKLDIDQLEMYQVI